jgi:hypothetical protein
LCAAYSFVFHYSEAALQFLTSNDKAPAAAKKGRIEKPYLLTHRFYYLTTKACHS